LALKERREAHPTPAIDQKVALDDSLTNVGCRDRPILQRCITASRRFRLMKLHVGDVCEEDAVGMKSTIWLRVPLPCVVSLLQLSTNRRYSAGHVVPARMLGSGGQGDRPNHLTGVVVQRARAVTCSTAPSVVNRHRMPSFNRRDCLEFAYVIVRKVPVARSRHDQLLVFSVRTWRFRLRITKVREHPLRSVLVSL
jgi:hypothetical protein